MGGEQKSLRCLARCIWYLADLEASSPSEPYSSDGASDCGVASRERRKVVADPDTAKCRICPPHPFLSLPRRSAAEKKRYADLCKDETAILDARRWDCGCPLHVGGPELVAPYTGTAAPKAPTNVKEVPKLSRALASAAEGSPRSSSSSSC